MPQLVVVPQEILTVLQGRRQSLDSFKDINYMLKHLSAADMADLVIASNDFAFEFDGLSIIDMEECVRAHIQQTEATDLERRFQTRLDTARLKYTEQVNNFVPVYQLYCVDETLWVAVQQKQHIDGCDPKRLLLKANSAFFDDLIANTLHTQSFESVCATPLFTHYLNSL